MNLLSRALVSLRGACSSTGRIAARSFSEAAAAAAEGAASRAATEAEKEGAKSRLLNKVLTNEFLTSTQVWEAAEPLGFKSKRFTKQMLAQLRKAGYVEAKPLPAAKTKKHTKRFGYRLHPKQQQAQQRQQQAA